MHPASPGTGLRRVGALVLLALAGLLVAALLSNRSELSAAARTATERVVNVNGVACSQPGRGVGVIVGNHVLTSGHLLDGMSTVDVVLQSGAVLPGEIVHIDRVADLGVVAAAVPDLGPISVMPARIGHEGRIDLVDIEGTRTSLTHTVERRLTARTDNVGRTEEIRRPSVQITATLERGDSGAPVWVDDDQLIGMVWAVSTSTDGRAFATQSEMIRSVIVDARTAPSGPRPC